MYNEYKTNEFNVLKPQVPIPVLGWLINIFQSLFHKLTVHVLSEDILHANVMYIITMFMQIHIAIINIYSKKYIYKCRFHAYITCSIEQSLLYSNRKRQEIWVL